MIKQNEKSEYDIQAENFLQEHGIAFSYRFLYHGPHGDEKTNRNVWQLTLSKGTGKGEQLELQFGQSIADSFLWPRDSGMYPLVRYNDRLKSRNPIYCENNKQPTQGIKPTVYEMLACITKHDPGTFEDFCGEYGYDTDSRKAEKLYFAVQEEWRKVRRFFNDKQLEQLQEIN